MANEANFVGVDVHTNQLGVNTTLTIPPGSITNSQISFATADRIDGSKVKHYYIGRYNVAEATTIVADTYPIFTAPAAGTLIKVYGTTLVAPTGGDLNWSYDLQKRSDGSASQASVLGSTVSAAATNNTAMTDGSVSTSTFAAGDMFSILIATTGSTGTQGLGCSIIAVFEV